MGIIIGSNNKLPISTIKLLCGMLAEKEAGTLSRGELRRSRETGELWSTLAPRFGRFPIIPGAIQKSKLVLVLSIVLTTIVEEEN